MTETGETNATRLQTRADPSGRVMLALSLWVLLLVVAVLNGYVREAHVLPLFGSGVAHVYGVVVLSGAVWLAAAYFARCTRGPAWLKWALGVGALWAGMTVAFEFLFGHYLAGKPWQELAQAYYVWQGELWPIVILSEAVAPALLGFRENRSGNL